MAASRAGDKSLARHASPSHIFPEGFVEEHPMAGGWARDGAVQEQIDASINDELARLKARRGPQGESLTHCADCEEPIPEKRRVAIPGVKLCIECQQERDSAYKSRGGINRRGSKDSQLK
jgi:phage/conjugal plasmid C-4 type zinc finger TraR family protein